MRQIIATTDGQFVGHEFDPTVPIILDNTEFIPDKIIIIDDGVFRYANSNYIFDAKETP